MIKKYQSVLIIFILIVINKFIPVISGNQEQYLGQAKQFFDPEWIPGSFSLSEPTGPRFLFDYLFGFLLSLFDFRSVALVGTLINMFLLSFPLARLSEKFSLSGLKLALWWEFILLSSVGFGAFFAGEWFIGEIEPKTIAYIGVLWGLVFYLEEKYIKTSIAFGLGALFHPLGAGWTFAAVILNELYYKNFKMCLKMAGIFILINAPLVAYYLPGVLLSGPKTVEGIPTSWVYTYFRVPNHTAPFATIENFREKFLPGIIELGIFVIFFGWARKREQNPCYKKLINYVLINTVLLSFFLVVAYFDTKGSFLKFYLFRSASTLQLLAYLLLFGMVWKAIENSSRNKKYDKAIMAILCVVAVVNLSKDIKRNFVEATEDSIEMNEKLEDLYAFARSTPEGTVFAVSELDPDKPGGMLDSFPRHTERDIYLNLKFLPSDATKLAEWYRRYLVTKEFDFKDEDVDLLISRKKISRLPKVFESKSGYKVYSI